LIEGEDSQALSDLVRYSLFLGFIPEEVRNTFEFSTQGLKDNIEKHKKFKESKPSINS
jgi:hypothetical protein